VFDDDDEENDVVVDVLRYDSRKLLTATRKLMRWIINNLLVYNILGFIFIYWDSTNSRIYLTIFSACSSVIALYREMRMPVRKKKKISCKLGPKKKENEQANSPPTELQ